MSSPSCRRSGCLTRCVQPATTAVTAGSGTTYGKYGRGLLRSLRCGSRRRRAIRARWISGRSDCLGDVDMRCWWCSATPGCCGCVSTRGRRCRSSSRGSRAPSVGSVACRRSSSSIRCARWSCRTTALRAASWRSMPSFCGSRPSGASCRGRAVLTGRRPRARWSARSGTCGRASSTAGRS